ncbi:hypothetical protein DNTS_032784 [Danionella cerebrum]|uniref:Myosin tail domain-containing protein n=1 Tax=Danionella cerebrum TaxID=2873325 RepID=A0A553R4M6_9TELE|nr:hypothetical protein DNTS_032784 [Danionella translucida]
MFSDQIPEAVKEVAEEEAKDARNECAANKHAVTPAGQWLYIVCVHFLQKVRCAGHLAAELCVVQMFPVQICSQLLLDLHIQSFSQGLHFVFKIYTMLALWLSICISERALKRWSVAVLDDDWSWSSTASRKSNLTRSSSVKDLICKFDASQTRNGSGKVKSGQGGKSKHDADESQKKQSRCEAQHREEKKDDKEESLVKSTEDSSEGILIPVPAAFPDVVVVPVSLSLLPQSSSCNGPKQHLEEEPSTPRSRTNPKYQLYLGSNNGPAVSNGSKNGSAGSSVGSSGSIGDGGGGSAPIGVSGGNLQRLGLMYRGSMESLTSRDWESSSDKIGGFESPPRVFNSPYSTLSLDYNPISRMSDYKPQEVMSAGMSEMNLLSVNRSASPLSSPVLTPRSRIPGYDSLTRRRDAPPGQLMQRSGPPSKRDFIQELTLQLDECRRRNQFLEAESVEMEKERNQIRFEMRGLLVNNEDLLRTNTQLQGEVHRLREHTVELESNHNVLLERLRRMEEELKEAREVMVEANTQEYAFNFLQQTLKNKIHDTEEALEKQTQDAQLVCEKLWLAERNLEELELEKENKAKKALELGNSVFRLETEVRNETELQPHLSVSPRDASYAFQLADALQEGNQARAELGLQQKLRADTQLRVEELEESLLEKEQELLRLTQIVSRLQGEVSDKLSDREQSLEEEIQLRERIQLQCKQAERSVDDLKMELHTLEQNRDELAKQLKFAQEKIIDLEADLEELQENEQRWVSKNKRALDQAEQLQMKLLQEKDLNDQLECDKAFLERQLRDLRSEVDELQNNRVEVDSITKAEIKAKELENALRAEERNKVSLMNSISKLERKIQELTEQLGEENKISSEQRELMTQRIRSLKRQLNEAEEEASRRDVQHRHTHRELVEERENNSRLQRQLLEHTLSNKRKESRQTLESLKLTLSEGEEEEEVQDGEKNKKSEPTSTEKQITQV